MSVSEGTGMYSYSVRADNDFRVEVIASDYANSEVLFNVFWFCLRAYHEEVDNPNRAEMDVVNWDKKSHTVMYNLQKQIFVSGNGRLLLLYNKEEQLIAISGVHKAKFDPFVLIGGVHSFVLSKFQGNTVVARYLIPLQIRIAAATLGAKTFVLPFLETKNIILDEDEQNWDWASLFKRKNYPPEFHDIYLHPQKIALQGRIQNVLVKEIEKGYKPRFLEIPSNDDQEEEDSDDK
jgi:hypothetical protein